MPDPVSQEMIDVVDAADRVIDVRARGEVHRLGLMHRSVHVLVFNSATELFIQKRSALKDNDPGLWDSSAAGHLDSGEDYLNCAIRELGEELGVPATVPLEHLFRLPPTEITGMEHCSVYRCMYDGTLVLQPEEIDEGAWISIEEMNRRVAEQDRTMTRVLQHIWNRFGINQQE